jgi:hypothetical protein
MNPKKPAMTRPDRGVSGVQRSLRVDVRRRVLTRHIGDGAGQSEEGESDLQLGRLKDGQDESECRGDLHTSHQRGLLNRAASVESGVDSTHGGCAEDTADRPEHEVGVLVWHERYDQVGPTRCQGGSSHPISRVRLTRPARRTRKRRRALPSTGRRHVPRREGRRRR